jgi:hypothetical protein
MIERKHRYGNLVFDRDAIVRAALRAYFEGIFRHGRPSRLASPGCDDPRWTGDLRRGAFHNGSEGPDYNVVAWTETGVIGLGYDLGFGPIEWLGLKVSAVTGGPDDVREALPGLPAELEPALVLATGMLLKGEWHGERLASVGFWLHGDRVDGSLFEKTADAGARDLALWGFLHNGWLLPRACFHDGYGRPLVLEHAPTRDAPIYALMDAVIDRRLRGPTELTPEELAMLVPDSGRMFGAERMLRKAGITWPGSPEIPEPPPPPKEARNPFYAPATMVGRDHPEGHLGFDHDPIVRAALRAYLEAILSQLDPLERHKFTACVVPGWTGDVRRGAFFNGNGRGDYDVIAWTEAGIVGLTYQRGYGPLEQLGLSASQVTGGPDDVRGALPGLPAELSPALVLAAGLLEVGAHGERLAGVGFWLQGHRVEGTLFDNPKAPGVFRLAYWGKLEFRGRLPLVYDPEIIALKRNVTFNMVEPIKALADAVADRAFAGPTELTADELALLLPTPPDPERLLGAQRMLQKVGITWQGSPEIPEPPPRE